ncbi:hypothetical protein PR048_026969 [Dryococelus australis]|uniref:Uncharacterized protein n=1 Tax=Dryococelus australis TaxID=614101 RepID=A0ABQ9GMU8_9NEOP|nr:hypothetical protein PR048_026969 [Dryococelus australis]
MQPVLSKLKGRNLHIQSREVGHDVLMFMQEEARNGICNIPVEKERFRTAYGTRVLERRVRKIKTKAKDATKESGPSFSTPNKQPNRKKTCYNIR